MLLAIRLSRCDAVCVSAKLQLHTHHVSLGSSEGNALYPVQSSLQTADAEYLSCLLVILVPVNYN